MTESIYRAMNALSYREQQNRSRKQTKFRTTLSSKVYIAFATSMLISICFAGMYYFIQHEYIKFGSMAFLIFGYILYIFHPLIIIAEHRKFIFWYFNNPLNYIFNDVKSESRLHEKYLNYFLTKSTNSLKLVLLQLKTEKEAFEKRVSLVVGSIDKIGLAPGLIALIASWDKIENIKFDWILSLAYSIPILYIFSVFCHNTISKLSSHVALLELAIEQKTQQDH